MLKAKIFCSLSILTALFAGFMGSNSFAGVPKTAEILERIQSPYNGELIVLDYSGARYLLARAVRGIVLQSSMDLHRHEALTSDYLKIMALLTGLHQKPTHIFNLGLGGGGLPRYQLQKCADCWVESAEIDPIVLNIAKKYFDIAHPRHKLFDGEGFSTLKAQSLKYDVIWVDAVLPKEGPRAYMKAKDLDTLHEHLQNDGIIIANLGEATTAKLFGEVENGYKRRYSHGIRIQVPVQDFTDTLTHLQSLVSQKVGQEHKLFPSYLIAVGNSSALNCKQFWSLYQQWFKEKLTSLKWDPSDQTKHLELCQDLI